MKNLYLTACLALFSLNAQSLDKKVTEPLIDEKFKQAVIDKDESLKKACPRKKLKSYNKYFSCRTKHKTPPEILERLRGEQDYAVVNYSKFSLTSLKKLKADLSSLQKKARVTIHSNTEKGELTYDILEKEIGFVDDLILNYRRKNCKTFEHKSKVGRTEYVYEAFNCPEDAEK